LCHYTSHSASAVCTVLPSVPTPTTPRDETVVEKRADNGHGAACSAPRVRRVSVAGVPSRLPHPLMRRAIGIAGLVTGLCPLQDTGARRLWNTPGRFCRASVCSNLSWPPLKEPERTRPHSYLPPWRLEGGTREELAGKRLLYRTGRKERGDPLNTAIDKMTKKTRDLRRQDGERENAPPPLRRSHSHVQCLWPNPHSNGQGRDMAGSEGCTSSQQLSLFSLGGEDPAKCMQVRLFATATPCGPVHYRFTLKPALVACAVPPPHSGALTFGAEIRLIAFPSQRAEQTEALVRCDKSPATRHVQRREVFLNPSPTPPPPQDKCTSFLEVIVQATEKPLVGEDRIGPPVLARLRKAVMDHISDSFLETNVPLLVLIEAAKSGNEKEVKEYAQVFREHANKLVEVSPRVPRDVTTETAPHSSDPCIRKRSKQAAVQAAVQASVQALVQTTVQASPLVSVQAAQRPGCWLQTSSCLLPLLPPATFLQQFGHFDRGLDASSVQEARDPCELASPPRVIHRARKSRAPGTTARKIESPGGGVYLQGGFDSEGYAFNLGTRKWMWQALKEGEIPRPSWARIGSATPRLPTSGSRCEEQRHVMTNVVTGHRGAPLVPPIWTVLAMPPRHSLGHWFAVSDSSREEKLLQTFVITSRGQVLRVSLGPAPGAWYRLMNAGNLQVNFEKRIGLLRVANLACSISNNEEGVKLVRMAATQIDSLCPQVINAALTLAARPQSKVAQDNMDVFKDQWEKQVRILTEAVDDITSVDDFLSVSENHILEDVNKCVIALQEGDMDTLDRTAGAIRGRAARVVHIINAEMENYEPGVYTERVLETLRLLSETVMPRFAEQVEVAIEALSTCPPQPFEENEFIDASRLVYDGVRDIRKAVLMIRTPEELEDDSDFEQEDYDTRSRTSVQTEDDQLIAGQSARAIMAQLPQEEKAKIAEQVESFRQEKSKLDAEVAKWDDNGNDIIVLAKQMCMIMMEMTDFTRGKGPLKNSSDVINAAKKIAEAGSRMDKLARAVADQCPDSACKQDLLAYLQRIALYCHQLNICSKVKAEVQNLGGELIVSGLDSATSLIQAAKNLMNAVVLTVKASYVASTKYQKVYGTAAVNSPVVSWRMKVPEKKPLVKREKPEECQTRVRRGSQKKHISPVQALSEFKAMDSF
ncbi:hypothetical protein P4O66_012737, partial [Electrophorus voltai]